MDFDTVLRTTGACRDFAPDPVPADLLYRAVELARFAPQGGNRQGVRLVIVQDQEKRRQLAELYQGAMAAHRSGTGPVQQQPRRGTAMTVRQGSDYLAEHLAEVPVIIVVCVDLNLVHATDTGLGRLSIVGGGSVYPFVQNLLLALRSLGLGASITTLLCEYEPQVKQLLAIPAEYATAAHLPVGYPARPFPTRLSRRTVPELAFIDEFGVPLGTE